MALLNIFAIALATIIAGQQVSAFAPSTHISVDIAQHVKKMSPQCALSQCLPSSRTDKLRKVHLSLEGDGDDDGWGTTESDTEQGDNRSVRSQKERDLQVLRSQVESKGKTARAVSSGSTTDNQEQERDLFIPIFALVSLTGLFGAYGYEIVRLYLRGELYLPWNQ